MDELPDIELDDENHINNDNDDNKIKIEECCICMNDYNILKTICHFYCNHTFCNECVNQVLNSNNRLCPMCRSNAINKCDENNYNYNNYNNLQIDYVYLDSEERKKFSEQSFDYLIEHLNDKCDKSDIKLNFNHPIRELLFSVSDRNKKFNK